MGKVQIVKLKKFRADEAEKVTVREACRLISQFSGEADSSERSRLELDYLRAFSDSRLAEPFSDDHLVNIIEHARNLSVLLTPKDQQEPEIAGLLSQPGMRKALSTLAAQYAEKEDAAKSWRDSFKSVDQLEEGDVRMLIQDFLPEGINFIGALPGHGKTLFALSMVKAFTTGSLFLGKYKPEKIPCLYLIPESSGRAFRMRLKSFGIPNDPERFLCRTISEGMILKLDDPIVLKAVEVLKPVVILDTMIRFSEAADENSAAQNQAIAKNILDLRAAGAPAVIALHHSIKSFAEGDITLESCLRGTGDIAALCDSVYALRRDRVLHDSGNGPEELEVVCVKDRDIKNPPKPFRVALRYAKEDGTRASYIDETGDIHLVETMAVRIALESRFVRAVTDDPSIPREELSKELGIKLPALKKLSKSLGWARSPGRGSLWNLEADKTNPAVIEAAKQKEASEKETEQEEKETAGPVATAVAQLLRGR